MVFQAKIPAKVFQLNLAPRSTSRRSTRRATPSTSSSTASRFRDARSSVKLLIRVSPINPTFSRLGSQPYLFAGKVSVALHHLELMAVNKKASFQIHVETSDNAELAVSVTGPRWVFGPVNKGLSLNLLLLILLLRGNSLHLVPLTCVFNSVSYACVGW